MQEGGSLSGRGGSLSRRVSVQGVFLSRGDFSVQGVSVIEIGRYASYWNAFLFCMFFCHEKDYTTTKLYLITVSTHRFHQR